jgi:hypothetical protein
VVQAVLSLTLALAGFMAATSLVLTTSGGGERHEQLLFFVSFAAVLPLSLVGGPLVTRRLAACDGAAAAGLVAIAASSGLLVLVLLARVAYATGGDSTLGSPFFLVALLGLAVAIVLLARRPPPTLVPYGRRLWALPAALLAATVLAFPPSDLLRPGELALGLALAAALLGLYLAATRRRAGRRVGPLLDVLVVVVTLLVANNLFAYRDPHGFFAIVADLHHNFFLGPTNSVLHGRPMLIDTFSQYGVGIFYFLAAWFSIVPIGYGGMVLLSGFLTSLQCALGYGIVRMAGGSRALALLALVAVVIGNFFAGGLPPPTAYPSTGALRWGLPYVLIAGALLFERLGRRRAAEAFPVAVLALTSIWSLETFVYTAAAFCGLAAVRAAARAERFTEWLRRLVVQLALGAVAVVAAVALFSLLTLVAAGSLPDWGGYLAFVDTYSIGGFGSLVMEPWSPGIALCALYVASATGLVTVAIRTPALLRAEQATFGAISATTAFGVAGFTYFLNRSYPDAAILIGLPAYLTAALWLTLLERHRAEIARPVRLLAVAVPVWALAMLVVFAWPDIRDRTDDTPLALAIPDGGRGGSLRFELDRLWHSPPLDQHVQVGQRLLRQYFPGSGPALVAAGSESTVYVLMQSRRVNRLPVSHFLQEALVMKQSLPRVERELSRLHGGELMLTDDGALASRALFPNPLLRRTIADIRTRFRLARVERTPDGWQVVRLVARRPGGA